LPFRNSGRNADGADDSYQTKRSGKVVMKLLHSGIFVRDLPPVSSVDLRRQYADRAHRLNIDTSYP